MGGPQDAAIGGEIGAPGALWIYIRSNGVWVQQGPKLLATGGANAELGYSVALSADGNTAIAGGPFDASLTGGAAWVFTRANGVWSQQGNKLVPSDVSGSHTQVGCSVALSADGNTALIGGRFDSNGAGAAWVFTRTNGVWSQQGAKLVGAGASSGSANQGSSVALSADGNTALLGGPEDGTATFAGAAWVFTRSNGVWSQQGPKLVGTGAIDGAIGAGQGFSVALSADGNTAVVGGPSDSPGQDEHCNYGGVQIDHVAAVGAAWVFTRTNGSWSQQGSKLVGTGAVAGVAHQGTAVALSADGNLALLGGPDDAQPGGDCEGTGANWVFTRRNGLWSQEGNKLVGSGSVNGPFGGSAQDVLGLSADGSTALIGGPSDNSFVGAVWVFTQPATTHFAVSAPTSAPNCLPTQLWSTERAASRRPSQPRATRPSRLPTPPWPPSQGLRARLRSTRRRPTSLSRRPRRPPPEPPSTSPWLRSIPPTTPCPPTPAPCTSAAPTAPRPSRPTPPSPTEPPPSPRRSIPRPARPSPRPTPRPHPSLEPPPRSWSQPRPPSRRRQCRSPRRAGTRRTPLTPLFTPIRAATST
ncbi:hypothetical protein SBA4_3210014 [Candidatus Sulfopaludibacter sp. SbA4]|nr:hypothetical protein SBA4_3210014 [Candidatus Sulfopaludibacter sp. SbA4]